MFIQEDVNYERHTRNSHRRKEVRIIRVRRDTRCPAFRGDCLRNRSGRCVQGRRSLRIKHTEEPQKEVLCPSEVPYQQRHALHTNFQPVAALHAEQDAFTFTAFMSNPTHYTASGGECTVPQKYLISTSFSHTRVPQHLRRLHEEQEWSTQSSAVFMSAPRHLTVLRPSTVPH